MDKYEPASIEDNVWIYIKIQKGMPGLKQAGKIAKNRLKKYLKNLFMNHCATPLRCGHMPPTKLSSPLWWIILG